MRTFIVLRQYPDLLGLQQSLATEIANLGVVAGGGHPVPRTSVVEGGVRCHGGAPAGGHRCLPVDGSGMTSRVEVAGETALRRLAR